MRISTFVAVVTLPLGLGACATGMTEVSGDAPMKEQAAFNERCVGAVPATDAAISECRQLASTLGVQWAPPVVTAQTVTALPPGTTIVVAPPGTQFVDAQVFPYLPAQWDGPAARGYRSSCAGRAVVGSQEQVSCNRLLSLANSEGASSAPIAAAAPVPTAPAIAFDAQSQIVQEAGVTSYDVYVTNREASAITCTVLSNVATGGQAQAVRATAAVPAGATQRILRAPGVSGPAQAQVTCSAPG